MYGLDYSIIEGLMLGFLRAGTAIALLPVFGYAAVPVQVKAGLALVLAVVLAPTAAQHIAVGPPGVVPIAAAALSEILVGMVFGLVGLLLLAGAQLMGSVVGVQMGYGFAVIADPQSGQISLLGKMEYTLALILFLLLDVHHQFVEALGYSFKVIPLGGALFPAEMSMSYTRLTAEVFVIGVKLGAPVIAMLFMIQVGLGFMARVMPRMNVFLVGFPVKIAVGLIGLAVTLPLFVYVLSKSFNYFVEGLLRIIALITGT